MSAGQATSLVQRKARTGREAQAARAMSLGRALRLTAALEAEKLMGLAVNALGITQHSTSHGSMLDCLDDQKLILLMDGPEGQVGAVMIEPVLVGGIIQQQTRGSVSAPPEGQEERGHTATDAALCAPLIEGILAGAAIMPEAPFERELLAGYRFGVWARETRNAQMALSAPAYEIIEMTLDLSGGLRAGKVVFILPEPSRGNVSEQEEDGSEASGEVDGQKILVGNVMGLQAELTVALTRLKMPFQDVSALKAGDLLNLNLTSMEQALVLDGKGVAISRGTLGQIDGQRALQVEQPKISAHTVPRRRAADRGELDLPDIGESTTMLPERRADDRMPELGKDVEIGSQAEIALPSMSDVDIFGDMDALPELPELELASAAADALQNAEDDLTDDPLQKTAGW